jgi:hypothetical protein
MAEAEAHVRSFQPRARRAARIAAPHDDGFTSGTIALREVLVHMIEE